MNAPVPGPVNLPQPQAKPIVPKRTLTRLAAGAQPSAPPPVEMGAIAVPPPPMPTPIRSFADGGEITGEDTTALWNQQEEDERKRQEAYLAGPLPPPAGPPTYTPSPAGAVVGGLIAKDPLSQPPSIRELAPPPAPDPIKEAANTWTPSQVVNMVAKAQELGLFDNVKAALPALAQEYTAKANAGDIPVPSGDPRIAGAQQANDNLARVQGILGPGIGGTIRDTAVKGIQAGLDSPALNLVPGGTAANAGLNAAGVNTPSVAQAYSQDIPVVSDVMRNTVVPAAGEIGAQAARVTDPLGIGSAISGAVGGPSAQDVGREVGKGIVPISIGDWALNAALAPKGAGLLERLDPIGISSLVNPAKAAATDVPIPSRGQPAFGPGSRGGTGNLPIPPATQPDELMDTFRQSIEARGGTVPTPPAATTEGQVYRLAVAPDAVTPLDPNSLMGSRGAVELTDPSKARILGPDEMPAEGETLLHHGTGAGGIQGDLRPGMNLTPDPKDAEVFGRTQARLEGGGTPPAPTAAEAGLAPPASPPPASPATSNLPINDPEKFQTAKLYTANDPPNPVLTYDPADKDASQLVANEARIRLYNAGLVGSGSDEQIIARYNNATVQGIKLPYDEVPSGMPDAFDLARSGRTPQSPLQTPPSNAVPIPPEVGQLQPPGSGAIRNADAIAADEGLSQAARDFLQTPNGQAAAAQRDASILANAAPEAIREEASRIAPSLGMSDSKALQIVDNWEGNARRTMDTGNPQGIARLAASLERPVEGGATGNFTDSFLTGLSQRRGELEQTLTRGTQLSPQQIRQVVDDAIDQRLTTHFGTDFQGLSQARQEIARNEARAQELAKDFKGLNTFVERTKNTMFPLDIGFFGQNVLTGFRQGGITTLAGMANRVALAMHIPFATNLEAITNMPRLLAASNDGLKLGNIASGLKPDEGTLLRYVPGLSAIDKHAVTPLIGKLTDAQYTGIGGFLKMMNYEGNLMALGKNISDPVVRREAARITNNAWSSAALATTPGRQQIEKLAFTSPAFTRSQVAVLTDMAKLIAPGASSSQRILAGTAILSNIAFAAGVYKYLNDQFGVGPAQLNPLQPGFGNITLPTKNENDRNHVVSLFPQRTFQTFATRAINAIGDQDSDAMLSALARLGAGRAGALPAAGARAFGYGYDSNGKFHMGGMDLEERVKASLPIPTSLQNVAMGGATDPLTMGFELAGLPNYESYGITKAQSERSLDRNELLQKGDRNQIFGPDLNKLIPSDVKYAELGSKEKQMLNGQFTPEQLAQYRKDAATQGSEVEKALMHQDAIREEFAPKFDRIQEALNKGLITPYEARTGAKALEAQMNETVHSVKLPEAGGDYKPSQIQQAEQGYRALYDLTKDKDGKQDYDALERLQLDYVQAVMQKYGDAFGGRLLANVLPGQNPSDPKLLQFYDSKEMRSAVGAYFDLPDNQKAGFKVADPQRDALLYAGGYTRNVASPAAAEAYKTYSEGKPEVNFNVGFRQEGYQTYRQMESGPMGKEVKEYQATAALDRDDYLRVHPDLNAALWQHGHTSHIYSLDAYDKVTGKTSTGATAAVQAPPPAPAVAAPQGSVVPVPSPAPAPQQPVSPLPTGAPRTLPPVAPGEFNSATASPQQRANFIEAIKGPANDYSAVTKIPPAVFAAIGASESNYGRAPSIFGIKGVGSAGGANLATHEVYGGQKVNINDQFAAYNNLDDAFNHFIDLTSHGRYANSWNELQRTGDWEGFLRGITAAGYATDKNWPASIISLTRDIERNYPQINRR